MPEGSATFLRGVDIRNAIETENGEPISRRPQGGIEGFVPNTRGGGLQSWDEDRVIERVNGEIRAARKDVE